MAADSILEMRPIVTRREALASGLPRYYTGKPCKRGHLSPRYTKLADCETCRAERPPANPDRYKITAAAYYQANKERIDARHKANAEKDPEKTAAMLADWYLRNKDRVAAHGRAWVAANPEKARAIAARWVKNNPEKARAQRENRRARARNAEGSHSEDDLKALFAAQKGKCAYCYGKIKSGGGRGGYHADHVVPLASGGSNWISNIKLACAPCNLKKGRKHPIAWAQENGRLL